jgi:thiol-disulfide isomerase/thioredoxin
MKKDVLLIAVISLVSAIAGVLLYRYTLFETEFVSADPASNSIPAKQEVTLAYEDIALEDLDGTTRFLKEWNHPIQVINFWAPWCAPCRREIPALTDIQQKYSESVQLIGLSFDTLKNVNAFKNEYSFNYPLLLVDKEAGRINHFFGNTSSALPYTVILNRKREIVFRHAGEIGSHQLEQEINNLM